MNAEQIIDEETYVPPTPETAKSFREFHDEMRKYRRRVFVRKDADAHTPFVREKTEAEAKFPGKKGRRYLKRLRQQARQNLGHFKGDNRTTAEALTQRQQTEKWIAAHTSTVEA